MRILLTLLAFLSICCASAERSENIEYFIGKTKLIGEVKEHFGKRLHVFNKVPFAKPPVGELRFQEPQKLNIEDLEKIDATPAMPACMQLVVTERKRLPAYSEDCLYMKIWVPEAVRNEYFSSKRRSPVAVIFYGGGFSTGAAIIPLYDGTILSLQENVIVVGFNYRVGAFGFMDFNTDDVPGNMGLLDQQLALQWVQENIGAFGGDPERVTAMGLSAGSMSIAAQILHETARPLFKTAVMDGGVILNAVEHYERSRERGLALAKALECDVSQDLGKVTECMKQKPAQHIVDAHLAIASNWILQFLPTFGSRFFPKHPKEVIEGVRGPLPRILIGTAKEEGTMFTTVTQPFMGGKLPNITTREDAAKQIAELMRSFNMQVPGDVSVYFNQIADGVIGFMTDGLFTCSALEYVDKLSTIGAETYLYQMNYFGESPIPGATPHAHHGVGFFYEMGLPLGKSDISNEERAVTASILHMTGGFISGQCPKFREQVLEQYQASRRRINVFETDGSLKIRFQHDRDPTCQRAWGYTIPKQRHEEL